MSFGQRPRLILIHLLFLYVGLVGKDQDRNILYGILFNLPHPYLDGIEGTLVSDAIDKQNAHGRFIIRRRDGFESLLSSSIP